MYYERVCRIQPLDVGSPERAGQDVHSLGLAFEWSAGEPVPALAALERIHDLAGDYINFLHPVRKLVSKTRSGPRVTRRYDLATTPFHRLLDSGVLSMK